MFLEECGCFWSRTGAGRGPHLHEVKNMQRVLHPSKNTPGDWTTPILIGSWRGGRRRRGEGDPKKIRIRLRRRGARGGGEYDCCRPPTKTNIRLRRRWGGLLCGLNFCKPGSVTVARRRERSSYGFCIVGIVGELHHDGEVLSGWGGGGRGSLFVFCLAELLSVGAGAKVPHLGRTSHQHERNW